MTSTSGMYPVWSQTAREFAERLTRISSVKAQSLAKRMQAYADEFETWSVVPSADERVRRSQVIGDYMTCYRDALSVFTQGPTA